MACPWLSYETRATAPIKIGDSRLVLFSRALIVRLPWLSGGLVWNRPVAALLISPTGREEILPISDFTRRFRWILLAIGAFVAGMIWLLYRQPKRRETYD